jgi:hypothetical protein
MMCSMVSPSVPQILHLSMIDCKPIIIIIIIIYYRVSGRLHNRKINLFIIIIIILKMYYNYLNMPPLPGGCWAFLPEYIHNYRKIMTMY